MGTYEQCASRKLSQHYKSYTYPQFLCAPGRTKHGREQWTHYGPQLYISHSKNVWVLRSIRARTILWFNRFSRTVFQPEAEKISTGHLKTYSLKLLPCTKPYVWENTLTMFPGCMGYVVVVARTPHALCLWGSPVGDLDRNNLTTRISREVLIEPGPAWKN